MRFTLSILIVASVCTTVGMLACKVTCFWPYGMCAFVGIMATFINLTSPRTGA